MGDKYETREDLIKEVNRLRKQNCELLSNVNRFNQDIKIKNKTIEQDYYKFKTLFYLIPIGVSICTDPTCREIIHNPVAAKFLRIDDWDSCSHSSENPPPFKIFKNNKELLPKEMPVQRCFWQGENTLNEELEFVWDDGVRKLYLFNAAPWINEMGSIIGVIAISEDITERKKQEIALRQSEDRFSKVFYSSPVMMTITRASDLKHLAVNDAWLETLGYQREDLIGSEALPEESFFLDRARIIDLIEEIRTNNSCRGLELDVRAKNGEIKTVYSNWDLITIDDEPYILGAAIDITERKRMEENLLEHLNYQIVTQKLLIQSEEKFYKAFHSIPIIMMLTRIDDGLILDVNEEFCKATGYHRDEVLGQTTRDINMFVDYAIRMDYVSRVLRDGRAVNEETEVRIKTGEIRSFRFWSRKLLIDGDECHITGSIDVTDQKRVQNELERLGRLNLIGEMAASISHEIRNPLTSVRGFLQMMSSKAEYANDLAYFDLMIDELDRANGIISEFLGMAKDKRVILEPHYLNKIVTSLYPMIHADAVYKGLEVRLNLESNLTALIDIKEIRQLILNMTRNGIEAMSDGGTLTIGTKDKNDHITLFVKDQGKGLDPGLIDKLGTPFLTTKENGTGLGLAVCYSIAARHSAKIDFDTGPTGTTFYVRFPLPMAQLSLF